MSCQGDPVPLTDAIVAERAARLAKIAEETCVEQFGESDLVYVIGTEVPVPCGAHETLAELEVTTPDAARATLKAHRHAFEKLGLIPSGPASLPSGCATRRRVRSYAHHRLPTAKSRRSEQNG